MVVMNKYIKNKQYKEKCYRRAKKEEPFWDFWCWSCFKPMSHMEAQNKVKEHFEQRENNLQTKVRYMDKGARKGATCPPKSFVKKYTKKRRAEIKNHMRHERYDSIERERNNAHWDWW